MWNLKQAKLMNITKKQIHRYREQTSGFQWGEGRGETGVGVKRHKLLCIK